MKYRETWDRFGNLISKEPELSAREITAEQFALRFSAEELAAIEQSGTASVIAARVRLMTRTEPLNLDSAELAGVLQLFVAVGILAADRPAAILS